MIAHDLALALKRYEQLYDALKPKLSLWQLIVMSKMSGDDKTSKEDQLAEKTGLNPAIVSNVLHTLRKKKYVKNVSTGRPKKVRITAEGLAAYEEARMLIRRVDGDFTDKVTLGALTAVLQEVTT